MMMIRKKSGLKLRVNVIIDILNQEGELIRSHRGHNLVVDSGLAILAAALATGDANITTFRVGSGNTPAVAGDVGLVSQIASFTPTLKSSSGPTASIQHYIGSGQLNGQTLREAGLFVGSTLFARFVYDDPDLQPKTLAHAVVFTWDITFAAV